MNAKGQVLAFHSIFWLIFFCSINANATKYVDTSLQQKTCNSVVTPGLADGVIWDVSSYPAVLASPYVRCSPLAAPYGSNYVEWNVPQVQKNVEPHGIGPDLNLPNPITLVSGKTYYLASHWRFERISGNALWTDWNFDFDKLIEMNGTGFRWIVLSGWNGDMAGALNKFTFSIYGSDAIVPNQCGSPGNWHYYSHDSNGYSKAQPLYSNYEKWISVVMGITAAGNGGIGHLALWIDGQKVIDKSCVNTMETQNNTQVPQINKIGLTGTVGQPNYVTPAHKRQVGRIMLTDDWQDIVNAGYVASTPSINNLKAPTRLKIL